MRINRNERWLLSCLSEAPSVWNIQDVISLPFQVYSPLTIMNRPVTPTKKSITPPSKSQMGRSSQSKSPIGRNSPQNPLLLEKLRQNREKLSHTLDTFTMLICSSRPIRCLEHNSVISVFCQTQNRLLCPNCIFTSPVHKFHKVAPVDKSQHILAQQLQKMTLQVENEARTIQRISETLLANLIQEEETALKSLEALSMRYTQAHQLLDECFLTIKTSLMGTLDELKVKHQTVALELNFLSDLYIAPLPLSSRKEEADPLQQLIYRHSMLSTLNKQKKFQGNVTPKVKNTWDNLSRRQLSRIDSVRDSLKESLSLCYQRC